MQAGDLIAERFELEALAGSGAMGLVFRARDRAHDGCLVALKTWRDDGSGVPGRFLREAAALAQLQAPALVGHCAHGLSAANEPFLAMEWIEGPTLAEQLAGPGLCPTDVLLLGRRVLQGLSALHAHGIVHRDLKPSNIMLPGARAADAKILDLGVARFAQVSADLTAEGSHVGTPRYMAPEQIRDPRRVDGRADVFALGCVLFEALTGVPAFAGDDPVAVLAQILFGHSMDPSELRTELPEEIDQLIGSLLARRVELRPQASSALCERFDVLLAAGDPAQLARLTPVARLPLSAAGTGVLPLGETLCDVSGERPSSPRLLDRASRPLHTLLARPPRHALIARENELAQLGRWLDDTHPITLWGGAGVGKTRLAQELARTAAQREIVPAFAVVQCDLSEARDSRDVARIVSQEVGVAVADHEDAEDFLGRTLGKLGPLMVVLDRCEHLAYEIELLIQLWLRHAPRLRLLVTSRVRLRSTREFEVAPLAIRARLSPGRASSSPASLEPSAAARLVLSLAAASSPELRGQESDAAVIEQAERIATALEGNALAIELALGHLPTLGLVGIVERLPAAGSSARATPDGSPARAALATGRIDGQPALPIAATMRAAIEWSWGLLAPAERSAFMQCALFHGPFGVRAAERVVMLDINTPSVLETLDSLRAQSLLLSRPSSAAGADSRLVMPAVLREFGREQLAARGRPQLLAARTRHAAYCAQLAFAQRNTSQLEVEDWLAALEHVLSSEGLDLAHATTILLSLEPLLMAAGPAGQLAQHLECTLQALATLPQPLEVALARQAARLLQLHARLSAPAGETASAERDLAWVLQEAARLHDAHLTGTALLDLGVVQHFRRELDRARDSYGSALVLLSETDDAVAEARCHGNLGAVSHDQAQLQDAAQGYRQAIALLPERGQERLLANFLGNLALVEHELGHLSQARGLYEQAVGLLEELLDARLLGIVLGNFGCLELAIDADERALACFVRANALLEKSGDRRSEGLSLARLGAALAINDRRPEAERRLAHAQRMLRKDGLARVVLMVLQAFVELNVATRAVRENQPSHAQQALDRVQVACDKARYEQVDGRAAFEQSDDLRLCLALLETRSARIAASRALGAGTRG